MIYMYVYLLYIFINGFLYAAIKNELNLWPAICNTQIEAEMEEAAAAEAETETVTES